MFPIDFLAKAARARPDAVALQGDHRSLTHAQLLAEAQAVACGLQALTGLDRPRVAVLSGNSLEMAVTLVAIHAGACWLVPINARSALTEVQQQLAAARADIVVVEPALVDRLEGVDLPRLFTTGEGEHTIGALALRHAGQRPRFAVSDPGAPNAIKFTGGSSGRPKAVVQSFRTVNTVVANVVHAFGLGPQDVYLMAAPMTHGAGSFMLPVLAAGGRCVIVDKPRPEALVDALARHGCTITWVPPTLLYMLMAVPGVGTLDFSRLRHLVWSGAPAAPEKLKQARAIFGPCLASAYGQAEAAAVATVIRADEITDERLLASVGRPTLLTQLEIRGPDGAVMPAGEAGEIWIRGDIRMLEYLDMPEATAAVLVDGWVRTGDVGLLDGDGRLFIKDRLRDVVISGGFNVYPSDVEDALCRHPAVHEAVVFGLPDDKWGERVEAAVQLRAGAAAEPEALAAWARDLLGGVKAPKRVHVLDALPRSNVGKVLRREVRQRFMP